MTCIDRYVCLQAPSAHEILKRKEELAALQNPIIAGGKTDTNTLTLSYKNIAPITLYDANALTFSY